MTNDLTFLMYKLKNYELIQRLAMISEPFLSSNAKSQLDLELNYLIGGKLEATFCIQAALHLPAVHGFFQ